MKSTGAIRKIDDLGRLVIPVEIRRLFSINIDDSVEIYTENNSIILKKYEPSCVFCGEAKGVICFKEKNICPKCVEAMADEINKH